MGKTEKSGGGWSAAETATAFRKKEKVAVDLTYRQLYLLPRLKILYESFERTRKRYESINLPTRLRIRNA